MTLTTKTSKRLTILFFASLLIFASIGAFAQQKPVKSQSFRLTSQVFNSSADATLCLDSDSNTETQDGGIVHLWECTDNATIWSFYADGTIRNDAGKCLDSDWHTWEQNGGIVHVWQCNNTPQQRWSSVESPHTPVFGTTGFYLKNDRGLCLDSDWHTMNDPGGVVHLWECNESRQQAWFYNLNMTFD